MEELLKLFLICSLMASAMIGIVLLIRKVFSKKMNTAVMLVLWAMVLVRLCIPFTFDSPVHMTDLIPQQSAPSAVQSQQTAPAAEPAGTPAAYQGGLQTNAQTASLNTAGTEADFGQNLTAFITSISLWNVLAFIWFAGMAATLLAFVRRAVRFRKKLAFCKPLFDEGILEIIRRHREQSGVKREITVLACDFVAVPAVCGYLKPRILIPTQFLEQMDKISMDAILLHEIYHVRCHDILINYVWLAVKALHWFNPLVWIAFGRFEDDVELCRDRMAAARLHADGTLVYSQSLVEAARISRKNAEPAPILTTSLFESRGKLKERVSRLMKPRKQSKASVTVCGLLAAVMLVACFTTACQPTPEKPFVISKQSSPVEAAKPSGSQAAQELANDKKVVKEQIEALGGHIQMDMKPNPKVTVKVDADIIQPEYDQLPLVRVKPTNFSKEQFDTWIKLLTDGQPVYFEDMQNPRSKEEINAALPKLKEDAANKDLPSYIKNAVESQINFMQEDYKKAGNKADEKTYDGTLIKAENNGTYSSITQLKCYMGKETAAQLSLWQSKNETQSQLTFSNSGIASAYNMYEPYTGTDAKKIKMSYQDAKAKAEDLVHKLDGENSNLALYESDIAYQIGMFDNYTKETSPQGYAFYYSRIYNGVPVKPIGYLWDPNPDIDYTKQVAPEMLEIVLDDQGFSMVTWLNHTETVEKVSDDMPLKDFDSIRDIFEQHMKQQFTWVPRNDALVGDDQNVTLTVKKVELNIMAIPEKDNLENYITVPVWDFIGDMKYDKKQAAQDGYPVDEPQNVSILTINAMDGSIINREQGF